MDYIYKFYYKNKDKYEDIFNNRVSDEFLN